MALWLDSRSVGPAVMGLSLANKFPVSELQVGVFSYLLRKFFLFGIAHR